MTFKIKTTVRKKSILKQFSYEGNDETVSDPEEHFQIFFCNTLLDQAIISFDERINQYKDFKKNFDFLFNIEALKNSADSYLKER